MSARIALRRLARNSRTLVLTSLGAAQYTIGCWLHGRRARPTRPQDPISAQLYDMQRYLDLSVARHSIHYKALVDDAKDHRRSYPTRQQYDMQTGFPIAYALGDELDTNELTHICDVLHQDQATIVNLARHNPKLVIDYLRTRNWDLQTQNDR